MTTPMQWELADQIIEQRLAHPALLAVSRDWDQIAAVLDELKKAGDGLKKCGAGRTEHATIVVARLVPALRELAETAALVADQMQQRLE